jgi:hypothetical protein
MGRELMLARALVQIARQCDRHGSGKRLIIVVVGYATLISCPVVAWHVTCPRENIDNADTGV